MVLYGVLGCCEYFVATGLSGLNHYQKYKDEAFSSWDAASRSSHVSRRNESKESQNTAPLPIELRHFQECILLHSGSLC
jgi:hypothetical protein